MKTLMSYQSFTTNKHFEFHYKFSRGKRSFFKKNVRLQMLAMYKLANKNSQIPICITLILLLLYCVKTFCQIEICFYYQDEISNLQRNFFGYIFAA